VDNPIHRQIQRGDLFLRQFDSNLPSQAAIDGDGGHTFDTLEAGDQIDLCHFAQRDAVEVALDANANDGRRVGIELEDGRRIRIFGEAAANTIDARAHLVSGLVQIRAPGKIQPDVARPFGRRGIDLLESRHGSQ
jgi:hypothetical protein